MIRFLMGTEDKTSIFVGRTAIATTTVTGQNTAKAVGSGSLDVYATPMMVALMERAACECLADALEPEQTSVGISVDIGHTAASPIGADITATATVVGIDGRKIEFEVAANDSKGEIGRGKHTRVIVDGERFTAKVR
jgi:predicted thioesterase